MFEENREQWFSELQVGSEVVVYCGLGRRDAVIGTVTRFTGTGNVAVIAKGKEAIYNKTYLTERGGAGDNYQQRIAPLTQVIREKIERKEMSDFIQSRNYIDNFTFDQLERIVNILYEVR